MVHLHPIPYSYVRSVKRSYKQYETSDTILFTMLDLFRKIMCDVDRRCYTGLVERGIVSSLSLLCPYFYLPLLQYV